ncbi:MAG: hypothetical protein ISN29_09905 [Gammaproteobacteria bacterium AqS3]|nr:hypothetical protein [Gammaproteobacteria bacterium AqS3]
MNQLSHTITSTLLGIQADEITVKAHLFAELPRMQIVGLPETVVRESKERIRSTLLMSQFQFLQQVIIVDLALAEIFKSGGGWTWSSPWAFCRLRGSSRRIRSGGNWDQY